MQCPHCGFENLDHARKCIGCGQVLATDLPAQQPPVPPLQPQDLQDLKGFRPAVLLNFNAGELFAQTFSVYFQHFTPFFLVGILVNIPLMVYNFSFGLHDPEAMDAEMTLPIGLGSILIAIVVASLATGALTYGVLQHLKKRSFSTGEILGVGLSLMVTVLAVALIQGIIIFVGALACIIPGIIAAVMLSVAVPVAVEERPGVFRALARSTNLTEGYRMGVFAVLFLIGLIHFCASFAIGVVSVVSPVASFFMSSLEATVYSGISATAGALIYYRLRCIKESVDIDGLASVFD